LQFSCFTLPNPFSAVPSASGSLFMFCAPTPIFGVIESRGQFSCFVLPDPFSAVPSTPSIFLMFALPDLYSVVPSVPGPDFIFCAPGHTFLAVQSALGTVFGVTEGVRSIFHGVKFSCFALPDLFSAVPSVVSSFHILRSRSHFQLYRARRVHLSCFALLDPFWALPRASGPIFMFCALGPIFGCTERAGSNFHDLLSLTRFRWYPAPCVQFSCFALSDLFSAVPSAPGPVFMFCAPRPVFGVTPSIGSSFHVTLSRTRFRLYRARRVQFSGSALSDLFSTLSWTPGLGFMLCAPGPIFGFTERIGSSFALPNPFSAVPSVGSSFMVLRTGPVFGGTEGTESSFNILRSRSRFRLYRACRVHFSSFALLDPFSALPRAEPIFEYIVLVWRSRTRFRRYRAPRVQFSYFALPNLFSAVPSAPGPVFMFYAPRPVFGGTTGGGSNFLVLPSWTHFRRYRARRDQFSCFALPNTFLAIPRAPGPVFMFCAPGLVSGFTKCVESSFHVLRSQTRFRLYLRSSFHVFHVSTLFPHYRGRRFQFSCFALPDSFSAVPSAPGPIYIFSVVGPVFGGIERAGSCLHVLPYRTRFRRYRARRV
jgi:hypothetical protein